MNTNNIVPLIPYLLLAIFLLYVLITQIVDDIRMFVGEADRRKNGDGGSCSFSIDFQSYTKKEASL